MRIAVCIPTRGAILTETVQAIQRNIEMLRSVGGGQVVPIWCVSYDKPIPEGHNDCIRQAAAHDVDAVWFVEEDVIPPSMALVKQVQALRNGADLAFVDYPMVSMPKSGPQCYHRNPNGDVVWTGFGCTLISMQCFRAETFPLTTGMIGRWKDKDTERETILFTEGKSIYGGFDIWFGWQLYTHGYKLEVIPDIMCHHVRVAALGQREINNGLHKLEAVCSS